MFLVAIDVGNTTISMGVFDAQYKLLERWKFTTYRWRTGDEYRYLWRPALEPYRAQGLRFVLASVVPAVTGEIQYAVSKEYGAACRVVSAREPLPMQLKVDHPEEVGADRFINALAARAEFGTPCIVVDMGTATTLDVVDTEGAYCGGIIMPGAGISADALFSRTALLPRVALTQPPQVVGRNTVACLQSGLYYGPLCALEGLVKLIWAELGTVGKVILTGGGAEMFATRPEWCDAMEPDLTLRGLALLERERGSTKGTKGHEGTRKPIR